MFLQLGASGSPVQSAELGAPAGREQRGEPVPAAAGAEDRRPQNPDAAQTLLEGGMKEINHKYPHEDAAADVSHVVVCSQSSEVCLFLVQTLEDCLQGGVPTTDQLL